MLKQQYPAVILLLASTLAFVSVGCSSVNYLGTSSEPDKPVATPSDASAPKPNGTPTQGSTTGNPYEWALEAAQSATTSSQTAKSPDDWNQVVSQWRKAIDFLQAVPDSSPYKSIANTTIEDYQHQLSYAQQQVNRSSQISQPSTTVALPPPTTQKPYTQNPSVVTSTPALSPPARQPQPITAIPSVFSATIKRRSGGTPIIDVTFNGTQTFEMVLDSGASTTVITPGMAAQLGVRLENQVMADTASAKKVRFGAGKVQSIGIDGIMVKNFPVAIAGSNLDTGLLGQDFFGNYDVLIKRDVVEFHPR